MICGLLVARNNFSVQYGSLVWTNKVMLAKDGCGNERLLSLKAGLLRAVNQTDLQTANGPNTGCVLESRIQSLEMSSIELFLPSCLLSSLLPLLPLHDTLIHCLVFRLKLSVPYKIFVGIKQGNRLVGICKDSNVLQMCIQTIKQE